MKCGQVAGIFGQHLDARLQRHHHEGGGHAFAGNIAQGERDAAIGIGEEIVVVAADGAAGSVETREIGAGNFGGFVGQHAALNFGGLGEVALHDALGLFDFGEAGVLDADGGHVGHDGEQAEIVLGEFAQNEGRVQIDEADDAVLGLQGARPSWCGPSAPRCSCGP